MGPISLLDSDIPSDIIVGQTPRANTKGKPQDYILGKLYVIIQIPATVSTPRVRRPVCVDVAENEKIRTSAQFFNNFSRTFVRQN